MYNKAVINTKELLKGNTDILLKDYILEDIKETVENHGDQLLPLSVLNIIADIKDPRSNYGVLSTLKHIYTQIGTWDTVCKSAYEIVSRYVRKNNLIYMSVFNSLDNKNFTTYVGSLNKIIGNDMDTMADILAKKHNLDHSMAKVVIDIIVYLNSYNGFILEYMVSEMVAIHPTLKVLTEGIVLNGNKYTPSMLDKDWGIDLIVTTNDSDIHIPLQIKSYTHLGKSRTSLQHTFTDHIEYKMKHKGLLDRESKGNVYYLHYRATDLSLMIPKADFNYTLPQSKELMHRVFDTSKLTYNRIPIWEVCYLLDEVAEQIAKYVWEE